MTRKQEQASGEMVKTTGIMRVSVDDRSNPELASELSDLRGSMYSMIPAMPERFVFGPHPDRPAIIVRDSADKSREPLVVGLCDSHGVSHMLTFLTRLTWTGADGAGSALNQAFSSANPFVVYECPISRETQQIGLCNLRGARLAADWLGVTVTRIDS